VSGAEKASRSRDAAERSNSSLLKERKTWLINTLFWIGAGLISWLLEYALSFFNPDGHYTLGRAAARLVYAALWWCVTVFVFWSSEALTVRRPSQYMRLTFHILVAMVITILWAVLAYYINLTIIPGWQPLGVQRMISSTFLTTYFHYIGMFALVHGIVLVRESYVREINALQKERLRDRAELQVLKMELQPHFLFNTLNAISTLMHKDMKTAHEMLVLLGDMLEAAPQNVRDQEVTLEEELRTLKLYVRIQQVRFGDRLRADYDIDPNGLGARVPHMIFQPLVENAIKHGIADRATGGRIAIVARVVDGRLRLVVQDDGFGLRNARPGHGLGLKNTRERLAALYGAQHEFELQAGEESGVRVAVSIPLRRGDST
jgi:LytS/YehU family sensor histidine kinase